MGRKELSKYKLLAYPDRLYDIVNKNDTFPVTVEIDPINSCSHRCKLCADGKFERTGDRIELSDMERILPEIKDLGGRSIIFKGGGEPTLHPDLDKFILLAKEYGFELGMLTNGELLYGELNEIVVENLSYIRISLDAIDANDHVRWHNPASGVRAFGKIIRNIENLVDWKRKLKTPILVSVNVLYDNETFLHLDEAIVLGEKLGIDVLSFREAFTECYGYENPWTEDGKKACDSYLLNLKRTVNGNMTIMWDASRGEEVKKFDEDNLPYCYATPLILVICANMRIYPCCDLRWMDKYEYGDLRKDSLEKIWRSAQRKSVLNDIIIPKLCKKYCSHRFAYFNDIFCYLKDKDKPHLALL